MTVAEAITGLQKALEPVTPQDTAATVVRYRVANAAFVAALQQARKSAVGPKPAFVAGGGQ